MEIQCISQGFPVRYIIRNYNYLLQGIVSLGYGAGKSQDLQSARHSERHFSLRLKAGRDQRPAQTVR